MSRLMVMAIAQLALVLGAAGAAEQAKPPRPTFDCAKTTNEIEALICKDPGLIALDRKLADAFAAAIKKWPTRLAAEQRTVQRSWLSDRNSCGTADDARACVEVTYQMRIVEVQILSGQVKGGPPIDFVCTGGEDRPFTATFYQETEPRSAMLMFGGDRVIAFVARSASGARYTAPNVDFWDRQGEATLTWFDTRLMCKPVA